MNRMNSALVVVAHPDDETIWMGGTILQKKSWDWTILSLCRSEDPDRAPKFKKVSAYLGAKGIISNLDDEHLEPLTIREVEEKIKENLPKKKFDYIFTHGANGEYGHLRHKEVHKAVTHLVQKNEIECGKLMYFSYQPSPQTVPNIPSLHIPLPTPIGDMKTILTQKDLETKQKVVHELYGFENQSFEVLACNKEETFKSH